MIYSLDFSKTAKKAVAKYKKSNPILYKKMEKLLDELMNIPEQEQDTLIYDIYDEIITVLVLEI